MPIIDVTLIEGRDPETKRALMAALSDAAARTLGVPLATVRVILRELPAAHFSVGGVPKSDRDPDRR
jgi:4-oxalocrotonate tautomerase